MRSGGSITCERAGSRSWRTGCPFVSKGVCCGFVSNTVSLIEMARYLNFFSWIGGEDTKAVEFFELLYEERYYMN